MSTSTHPAPRRRARPRRWQRALLIACGAIVLLANLVAWLQARSMTRFDASGARTVEPGSLTTGQKLAVLIRGVSIPRPMNRRTPADLGLEFTTYTIPSVNGRSLEVWRIPVAAPRGTAILVHGYAASKDQLLTAAATLHDLGFETVLVDFPGSGGSSGDRTSLGWYEADDVASVVAGERRLHPERRIVLVGGSMGAVAILRAAAERGVTADALILENPFDRLADAIGARFDAMGLPASPGTELLLFWGSVELGFNAFSHNPVTYARSVRVPTLMFEGERDDRSTPAQARAVFDRISAPKELVMVPRAGHGPLSRMAPQLWRERARSFLDRHLPPSPAQR